MRQHYVSRFYLENFADSSAGREPGLWVVDGSIGVVKPLRPDAVAAIVNYYTVDVEGQKDDLVEQAFAGLEAAVAPVLKRLTEGNLRLSSDERALVSEFMAAQKIRVPAFRDQIEGFERDVNAKLLQIATSDRSIYARVIREAHPDRDFTEDEIDRLWHFARDPSRFAIRINPQTSLAEGLKLVEMLAGTFAAMHWSFLRASDAVPMLTSDNPVSWRNPEFADSAYGHGLLAPGTQLAWPIGRSLALIGTWRGSQGVYDADPVLTEKLNRRVITTSERYVFCPSQASAKWVQEQRSKWLARKGEPC